MRIDGTSLIAAQAGFETQRVQQAARPATQAAGKPLFEPLNFSKAELEPTSSKPADAGPQTGFRRPGAQLDITV